jgi:F0F1-type ATP synthase epsilon subunit
MAKTFKIKVITPEKMFYSGDAELVIVRTSGGDEGYNG